MAAIQRVPTELAFDRKNFWTHVRGGYGPWLVLLHLTDMHLSSLLWWAQPWCGACHPDAADRPAGRAASARRSASLPRPLPPVVEAPSSEASATQVEEAAARCGAKFSRPCEGEQGAPGLEGGDRSTGSAGLAHTPSGSNSGSGCAGSGDERLRQLSPVVEATSSIERGDASETGSVASLASGPSGHAQHHSAGINLPQVWGAMHAQREIAIRLHPCPRALVLSQHVLAHPPGLSLRASCEYLPSLQGRLCLRSVRLSATQWKYA